MRLHLALPEFEMVGNVAFSISDPASGDLDGQNKGIVVLGCTTALFEKSIDTSSKLTEMKSSRDVSP